ncbi:PLASMODESMATA CALLOSE-BINDING PROTEIN 3 [Bienertia sinuspersici]
MDHHHLLVPIIVILILLFHYQPLQVVEGVWCVARAGANEHSLQSALDYACAAGADCGPIQQSGLCFLPNTLQAHASYAFNSFYQRNHMAATSCDFSGTATLAKTDPSYGSCVYPSSSRYVNFFFSFLFLLLQVFFHVIVYDILFFFLFGCCLPLTLIYA